MLRFFRFIAEIIAGLVAVAIVLGVLLAWRISTSPVSSDFLTPYIEAGIGEILPDSQVALGSSLLEWNHTECAITLHVENLKILDAQGNDIADVPAVDARLSILALIFGHFMPTDLTIDQPQLNIIHDATGAYLFGGRVMFQPGPGKSDAAGIGTMLRTISYRLSHNAALHKLAVTHARLDVQDAILQKDWAVTVPEVSLTRGALGAHEHPLEPGALQGRMTVEVTQKDAPAELDIHYAYDPLKETHEFSSTFSDLTPAFFAGGHPESLGFSAAAMLDMPLTGHFAVSLDRHFALIAASSHIHGGAGQVIDPALWDKPLAVSDFDFNIDYDGVQQTLSISDTQADLNGATLALKVDGAKSAQEKQDLDFTTVLTIDNLPMNRYSEVWPKPLLPDPRYWLEANLRDGIFTHAELTAKGSLAWNDLAATDIAEGTGTLAASGATVTYLDGMPPAENVSANGTFDLKKMDIQVTGGGIGNIRISPFTLHITGLADPDQNIDIPLQVSGPIPEVMKLLDHPPLGYAKALGLSPDDIGGTISGNVRFRLPLLKTVEMKDMSIDAAAHASGVASTKLVPGIAIDQGELDMTLTLDGFAFKGQSLLNRLPFQVAWQQSFDKNAKILSSATISGAIKDEQWNNFGIGFFDGSKGPSNVTLDIKRTAKNKMTYSGSVDMTPAAITFPMLNWKKPAGTAAILKFNASQISGKPVEIPSLSLHGAQLLASGKATLTPDMAQILTLDMQPLQVGRTNAVVHFAQTFGDDGLLRFDATGASLDVSGMRGDKNPERNDARPKQYHLKLDKLFAGDSSEVDKTEGALYRDRQGWQQISLRGMADGDSPLEMELTPQPSGYSTLKINCADFGKSMKALGFTDTISGGRLSISGQSTVDNPRLIEGNIKISDFTVQRLPALALLLNATSPFGFKGIVTDSADFSRFQGDFKWQGDQVDLIKAHAAGSAIGINIDGRADLNTGDAHLAGTLVPFSAVNDVLNYIPLVGDLITGGENQGVLAVAYQINGNLSAPKVSVNPVSLLTPGFIRNLFFGYDPSEDKNKEE